VNQSGTQDTSGNAATATALATAKTIGGVAFDGTSNINLPGVNTAGTQDTSGNAATATALATAKTIGGVAFDGTGNINLPGVNSGGNQNTTGSAATLTTSRNINGVGFNGSSDIKIPGTITYKKQLDRSLSIKYISTSFVEIHTDLRMKYVATQTNITCHFTITRLRANGKTLYYQIYDWHNNTYHGTKSQYYFHYAGSSGGYNGPVHITHTLHNLTVGNTYYFTVRLKATSYAAYAYPSHTYGHTNIYTTEHITGGSNSGSGAGINVGDTEIAEDY
tara:strand:- start:876 stop:1706 length:831 start_codon:yes stop_codon:yes gene_type:complete